jgi:DNA-binding PadR family transcriptional regulator
MVPDSVMKLPGLTLTAKYILCRIARYQQRDIRPSQASLACAAGVSARTVRSAIKQLQEADLIVAKQIGKKQNNLYTLTECGRQHFPVTRREKFSAKSGKCFRANGEKTSDPYRETAYIQIEKSASKKTDDKIRTPLDEYGGDGTRSQRRRLRQRIRDGVPRDQWESDLRALPNSVISEEHESVAGHRKLQERMERIFGIGNETSQ